ncbi:helix-turn-helix domain-containing protein, partial [Streptomyces sp. ID05-39B]|uniref:helix-turn-helix transcriptional regulator n=1 Tax=Streptomyces sp. ID05-39B TaxID=3028664 RepID=UPI0029B6298A
MTQSFDTPLPPPKERRRLRELGSLTQAQLATRLGVSRETVRAWETGRSTPSGRKRESYGKLLASLAAVEPPAEVTASRSPEPAPKLTAGLSEPGSNPEPPTPASST